MCQIRMYNCTFTNDCEETSAERICMTIEVFLNQKQNQIFIGYFPGKLI